MQQCAPERSQECSAAAEELLSGGRRAYLIGTRTENNSRAISIGRWVESSDSTSRGATHEKVLKGLPQNSARKNRTDGRGELQAERYNEKKVWARKGYRYKKLKYSCEKIF